MNPNKVFGWLVGWFVGWLVGWVFFMRLDELILKSKKKSRQERVNSAGLGCPDPAHSKEKLLPGKYPQSPWNSLPEEVLCMLAALGHAVPRLSW